MGRADQVARARRAELRPGLERATELARAGVLTFEEQAELDAWRSQEIDRKAAAAAAETAARKAAEEVPDAIDRA